jgi:hypothetical protein
MKTKQLGFPTGHDTTIGGARYRLAGVASLIRVNGNGRTIGQPHFGINQGIAQGPVHTFDTGTQRTLTAVEPTL